MRASSSEVFTASTEVALDGIRAGGVDPRVIDITNAVARSRHPPIYQLGLADARIAFGRASASMTLPPTSVVRATDHWVGAEESAITIRQYVGCETKDAMPSILFVHGGGWALGSIDTHDTICRALANEARCHVFSVNYRLAPERKFPLPIEDVVRAYVWVQGNACLLGVDKGRIAICGDSAGGNLAVAAARIINSSRAPATIGLQILFYPVLSLVLTDLEQYLGNGYLFDLEMLTWCSEHYLPSQAERSDPLASPARAKDLSGEPDTILVTAGFDMTARTSLIYAAALKRIGKRVHVCHEPRLVHGFLSLGRVLPQAALAIASVAAVARQWWGSPPQARGVSAAGT